MQMALRAFYTCIVLGTTFLAHPVQAATSLTTDGCADPSGLAKCQSSTNDKTSSCIAQAKKDNSQVEILACTCQDYVNNINCYATHCWNRIWQCEYQDYAVGYLKDCVDAKQPIPYFPAPDDAPNACSCNLGKVFNAVEGAITQNAACSNNADGADASSNLQQIEGCACCAISGALSSLVEICPNTDPKLIGLSSIQQVEKNLNVDFPNCGSYIQQYDCVSDLGYDLKGVSSYYLPDDEYKTGTATLSNEKGTVTAPASGNVFTWTDIGDKQVYTITAAGVKDKDSSGSSGSSDDSASTSGAGSGGDSTDSSASAAKTSAKDDAEDAASAFKAGVFMPLSVLAFAMAMNM